MTAFFRINRHELIGHYKMTLLRLSGILKKERRKKRLDDWHMRILLVHRLFQSDIKTLVEKEKKIEKEKTHKFE